MKKIGSEICTAFFMPAPFSGENRGPEIHTVSFIPATFSNEKDRVRNIKKRPAENVSAGALCLVSVVAC